MRNSIVTVMTKHDPNEPALTCDEVRRQNARYARAVVNGTCDMKAALAYSNIVRSDALHLALKSKIANSAGIKFTPDMLEYAGVKVEQESDGHV